MTICLRQIKSHSSDEEKVKSNGKKKYIESFVFKDAIKFCQIGPYLIRIREMDVAYLQNIHKQMNTDRTPKSKADGKSLMTLEESFRPFPPLIPKTSFYL